MKLLTSCYVLPVAFRSNFAVKQNIGDKIINDENGSEDKSVNENENENETNDVDDGMMVNEYDGRGSEEEIEIIDENTGNDECGVIAEMEESDEMEIMHNEKEEETNNSESNEVTYYTDTLTSPPCSTSFPTSSSSSSSSSAVNNIPCVSSFQYADLFADPANITEGKQLSVSSSYIKVIMSYFTCLKRNMTHHIFCISHICI